MHCIQKASLFLLLACFFVQPSFAKKEKKPETEQGLIRRLLGCMSNQDAYCYVDLWPDLDTLTSVVMEKSPKGSADYVDAYYLQRQPLKVMRADSIFQARLRTNFDTVMARGKRLGIHWDGIILSHYELIRQGQTRDTLYERLAPTRFVGYLFFMDIATGRNFGVMVGNILNINGGWWGGELTNVYPATNRDEWQAAYRADLKEQRRIQSLPPDSVTAAAPPGENVPDEDEPEKKPVATGNVVSRTYYSGMLDAEIPVQLYLRGLSGGCPKQECGWEAIYKFGDQDDYILLDVSKTPEGKWLFTEVPPAAVMELELKNDTITGSWISTDDQTGYDVKMTKHDASAKRISHLDKIFASLKEAARAGAQ